jgi:hypothetical protein
VIVELPDHPFFAGTVMQPDPDLLDELAGGYRARTPVASRAMTRFLFGDAPVALFDRIFAADDPASLPTGGFLWVFHLSGYFGGVWLRDELARSGHNEAIAGFSVTPSEAAFVDETDRAARALAAAAGGTDALLAYSEASLFDTANPDPAPPTPGLVDSFGYNQGYLLQIVEQPPEGLTTPPGLVVCPARAAEGPLACTYATSRLRALTTFADVSSALARGDGAYGALAARVAPLQDAGVARGRTVWDGMLNVAGFAQDAYEQLLDISSAFLETVQATVLATARAVAEGDAPAGRRGAVANACMGVWLTSYLVGITDGRPGRSLPRFADEQE